VIIIGIVAAIVVLAIVSIAMVYSTNYIKAEPNEAIVLTGRKYKVELAETDASGNVTKRTVTRGWRVLAGGGGLQVPILEKKSRISLGNMNLADVRVERAYSKEGVAVTIDAVANVKISSEVDLLARAVERFLGVSVKEVMGVVKETLEGQLRDIIGTMTIEELYQDRETFIQAVLTQSGEELAKFGILIDIINIQDIRDEQGYLDSLGKKRTAEVKRDATIGEAKADKEALIQSETARREGLVAKSEQERLTKEAEKSRDVEVQKYVGETAAATAQAEQQGPLNEAKARQAVVVEEQNVIAVETRAREAVVKAEQGVLRCEAEERQRVTEANQQILVIEQEKQAQIEEARAKAEENRQRAETVVPADAQKQRDILEAEGQSQAVSIAAKASADKIWLEAEAEAKGIEAKGKAEAQALEAKAEAYKKFESAAVLSLQLETIQAVAESASKSMAESKFEKVVIVDGGNTTGGGSATGSSAIARALNAGPTGMVKFSEELEAMTGFNLFESLRAHAEKQGTDAKS